MKRTIALLFAIMMLSAQVCAAAPAEAEGQRGAADTVVAAQAGGEVPEGAAAPAGKEDAARAAGERKGTALGSSVISTLTNLTPTSILDYLMSPAIEHLSVANPNPMRGQFFTELWGNITSDQDVRELLHAYNLIYWNGEEGVFTYDPSVVSAIEVTENQAGDRTYTFTLADDLYYSDGTRVTAWDYAFSLLLQIAPELEELGAHPAKKPQILGYQAYADGTAQTLTGVRVSADNTIAITIDNGYLPFFYEMALLSAQPYPASVIAPGVEVRDTGAGVYLANIDDTVTEPLFNAELLARTITDPVTGYQSHPSVVSGPYVLESWDGETAEFVINRYYKGNVHGSIPQVERITFSTADNAAIVEGLQSGKYDLLNKVMNTDTITKALELVGSEGLGDYFDTSNYPRVGMGYISFACEKPALAEQAVRQAIAWCMDRSRVTADYTSNYGMEVEGYYGVGQWLFGVVNGTVQPPVEEPAEGDARAQAEYEEKMKAFEELSLDKLTVYKVDLEKAKELLEGAGWELNRETGIREKKITVTPEGAGPGTAGREETVKLDFTLVYPETNEGIAKTLEENFVANLAEAGIRLKLVPIHFEDLLTQFYYPEKREADMFFLASNFDMIFDPSTYFLTETEEATGREVHTWVTTGCEDDALYEAAVAMRETEPGDVLTYCQHWVKFQERFNELLPMLPIYSNVYFDFYTAYLHEYKIEQNTSWGDAIVSSYLSGEKKVEEKETQEAEAEPGTADGLVEIGD